jgi:hypothetical protein
LIILTSYAGAHPRDVSTYRGSAVFIFANAKTVREYVVQAAAKLLCGITVCYHKRFPSFLSIVGGARRRQGDGSVSPVSPPCLLSAPPLEGKKNGQIPDQVMPLSNSITVRDLPVYDLII